MCYHTKQTKNLRAVESRFKAVAEQPSLFNETAIYNGFTFPRTPVILNNSPRIIKEINWGLIPAWSKDEQIKAYTLNAKIETLTLRPSFRDCIKNRCLIIADGFYEWKWLDETGKRKQKYQLTLINDMLFSFAGLYSEWLDQSTGEVRTTYTIVTTKANDLMSEIHNHKKRMPLVLNEEQESQWLSGQNVLDFQSAEVELIASKA